MPIIRELAFRQTNVSLINTSRVAGEHKLKSALTMHVTPRTPEQHARGGGRRISTTLPVSRFSNAHAHTRNPPSMGNSASRARARMCRECEHRSEHRSDARHLPSNGFHSFFSLSCHLSPSSSASSPTRAMRTPKASLGVFSRAEPRKNAFIHSSFSTRYGNAIEHAPNLPELVSSSSMLDVARSFSNCL